MAGGVFLVSGEEYDSAKFAALLCKWSFGGLTFANQNIEQSIPDFILFQKIGSARPRDILVLSYCIAVNLVAAYVKYDLPGEVVRNLDDLVIETFKRIPGADGMPHHSDAEISLSNHLRPKYFAEVVNLVNNPSALTYGPSDILVSDILEFYEIGSDAISTLDRMELTAKLNSMVGIALQDFEKLRPVYIM